MFSVFPIDIFPTGALSSSVITTVWVGVFVVVYLNLRLGTTLSGLVVPGYLVPLLILRPMSAGVIIAEGIITYWLANLLAEKLPRRLSYAELFGRDRFFALVLISIVVRLFFDGLLLPELGDYLSERGFEYDYRNNLHSFGLIIVALIANQMWNGGLRQGMTALFLYVGISYLIIRLLLMEYTNFNISTLSYMYEDLASSILASPKAYIILLVSAFIASRMNLKYGWEFNGILIPSLLALQWYQPEKLIVTLAESLVIYALAAGLLRLAFFKKMHIEGPRQILLFFNISFAYKMLLGYALVTFFPNEKVSDYYAFGYLLSTLLALKMYQKDIAIHIARSTLQTSLVGVLAASVIGFLLTMTPSIGGEKTANIAGEADIVNLLDADFEQHINKLRVNLYDSQRSTLSGQASPLEMDRLNQLFGDLKRYLKQPGEARLEPLLIQAQNLQLNLSLLNSRFLILEDSQSARGWGIFVFDIEDSSDLVIEVPAPLDELQAADAAVSLFRNLSAGALALAGKKRRQSADGTSDTLKNPQTAFQLFHRHFGVQSALQIRQYTSQSRRRLLGVRAEDLTPVQGREKNQLWVKKALPEALNLSLLNEMTGQLDVQWLPAPLENRQQESSPRGFAELFLTQAGIKKILSYAPSGESFVVENRAQRIDGYLLNWIGENEKLLAARGSNSYVPPRLSEMLFFDQNVLTPILALISDGLAGGWDESYKPDIQRINKLSLAVGYELILYHHQASGDDFLILQESSASVLRHWGTYVFRLGSAGPYMIEVPRPLAESNTLAFGANLFERLSARILLIAGAHPYANYDGTANLLHNANKLSLFNLVHQVSLREARDNAQLTLQLRAFSDRDNRMAASTDVLLAKLGIETNDYPLLTRPLEELLGNYGLNYEYVDGSPGTMGYDASWNAQARYGPFSLNKPFYVLWVSPDTRGSYRNQSENRQQKLKFAALGIETYELDVPGQLSQTPPPRHATPNIDDSALESFFLSENIVSLQQFIQRNPGYNFDRLVDINTGQAFLALKSSDGSLFSLVNLETHNNQQRGFPASASPDRDLLQQFVDDRSRWLRRGDHP